MRSQYADIPLPTRIHVHYAPTKLLIRDGLPKMNDLPAEMGISGLAFWNKPPGIPTCTPAT